MYGELYRGYKIWSIIYGYNVWRLIYMVKFMETIIEIAICGVTYIGYNEWRPI